jgi:SAM-dependent methyltransferase
MKDPRVLFRKLTTLLPIRNLHVVINEIELAIKNSPSLKVLDIGAGSGWYWREIAETIPYITINLTLLDAAEIAENLSNIPNLKITRIQGYAPSDMLRISDNAFDLVLAFDLIEHLSKEEGYLLLYEVDRIAAISSVIYTPNGFIWQPPSRNNTFNAHISGWTPRELKDLGWNKIVGHNGLKQLRESYGIQKKWMRSWPVLELDALLCIISWKLPRFSFAFSAVKRSKNPRIEDQEFS